VKRLALALLLALALPGVAGATEYEVEIPGLFYVPGDLVVLVGDTVTWTNQEAGVPHTTTSDTGVWDSGTLNTGQSFSFTFTQAGTFTYHCTIHPNMTGTVTAQ